LSWLLSRSAGVFFPFGVALFGILWEWPLVAVVSFPCRWSGALRLVAQGTARLEIVDSLLVGKRAESREALERPVVL